MPSLLAEATGSTFPNVSSQQLNQLAIKVPSATEQKIIADILKSFDDKIELNRQTNQTLEAIAQAIYKEWFVDFRFPHSPLEGCPKGGVDKGWQAKPDGVDSLQLTSVSPASWQKNSLFPFWTLPKNRTLQERSKELRKQGILSEVVFWKTFKDKKKLGWDIDRQVIIGNFIVDFFIPELVFEIDGSSHNDKQEYDQKRDAFLSSLQLKVVRIPGKDVLGNIEGVWRFVTRLIKERVEELSPPRPSGTPQEGKCPPRQASPATPQEGKKCEMQDSELGPIPKGWRVGKLGEVCEFAYGKGLKFESRIDGKYPVVGSNGIVGTHAEYFVDGPGVVIGRKGTIGEVLWIHQNFFPIDTTFYIKDLLGVKGLYFHYFLLKSQDFKKISSDSAVPGLNRNQAYDNTVTIPTKNNINEFNKIVRDMFENIQNNEQQSTALAAIRDALLPKLMSGEIAV
ncbi:MAG: hypothetical protein AYP45_03490 [Candidatus Brocadia carolinensis]|uniref:Type I restriction modification DNA specificity domain-containing protein n=1 Tax=Candidatus Brocadia carolinensis TaxID=1004156 RepID=A0A1V4AW89_9BACT|nr:MAG: hypothetical protein AYP45_03490 [Candidatus Brocadia caroliniensis]